LIALSMFRDIQQLRLDIGHAVCGLYTKMSECT